jgi:hypothetical protein
VHRPGSNVCQQRLVTRVDLVPLVNSGQPHLGDAVREQQHDRITVDLRCKPDREWILKLENRFSFSVWLTPRMSRAASQFRAASAPFVG